MRCPVARMLILLVACLAAEARGQAWRRHVIDDSSRGADGVRLGDVNQDGLADIVTGWEEGGVIRVYTHPGPAAVRQPWPRQTVGQVKSPEDAVLVDLDRDGALDVVSCCEGRTRTVFVHWAPGSRLAEPGASDWRTVALPVTRGAQMWMFAVAAELDGRRGIDLIVGAKGDRAEVGWLESPADPRRVERWRYHRLVPAGWIMSLITRDLDGDGDDDLVVSDRKGARRGVFWLENPGAAANRSGTPWREHRVGGPHHEVMFLDLADLDADGRDEVVTATRNGEILCFRPVDASLTRWQQTAIPNPFGVPHGKAVRVGDVNLDGRPDLVHTANTGGDRSKPGVAWLEYDERPGEPAWTAHDVSGARGVKFDLVELLDLDSDGDLDAITCEERDNLGVFWYENPHR